MWVASARCCATGCETASWDAADSYLERAVDRIHSLGLQAQTQMIVDRQPVLSNRPERDVDRTWGGRVPLKDRGTYQPRYYIWEALLVITLPWLASSAKEDV